MHMSTRLLFLTLLCCCFYFAGAQDIAKRKIKATYTNKSLDLVLLDLKIHYRLNFVYNPEDIKEVVVKANLPNLPLAEAMKVLLYGSNLDFEITAPNNVSLFKKGAARPQKLPEEPVVYIPVQRNFTLSGVVKDQSTGETLPFANVLIAGTTNGTTTNMDGYFTLFEVPADTVVLEISYLGYQTQRQRLTPGMEIKDAVFALSGNGVNLEEIIVEGVRQEQLMKASTGISSIGISPAALASLPNYGEKDIFRSLQLMPGVSGTNESSSGLYVRGGTPDQNLILLDGFTVYHVDHLFGFFSAFNANAIKDVQLYKGGFDAKYGGRISSVVQMTGKDGNTEQLNASIGLSLLSVNANAEAPFAGGKGSILLAGRRSFQSNFYSNIFDAFTQANQQSSPAPVQGPAGFGGRGFAQQSFQPNSFFYDLNAKITFRPSFRDNFSLSFYNGKDDLDNSRTTDNNSFQRRFGGAGANANFNFQSSNTDLTQWGNWGGSGAWSRQWNEHFFSNTILSYSNYFSERDRSNNTTVTRSDSSFTRTTGSLEYNDLKDFTLKSDMEWRLNKVNHLEFGLQTTYNDIQYSYTQNDTSVILDRKDEGWTTALYFQDKLTLKDRLILKAGLRATHYSVTNKNYLEPRASLTYLFNDKIKLKAATGKYYQFASRIVREDIQQGSRDFWLLADGERAPVSSAWHFIGGVSYETPTYLFDVEAYYKDLKGLSEYSTRFRPTGFGPGGTLSYEEFFYRGTGIAQGIEWLLQKKAGKLNGWIGYTLGKVRYNFDAFGSDAFPASHDQTHEFKWVGNYKLSRNLTLGATFIYGTGKPYTAPTGYYEITLLDGRQADFFEVSEKNALRFPDYHRFDFSVNYDFKLWEGRVNTGISFFNVYNRKNVWYREYEVIEGEIFETDVSLLGFTPSLFLTWSLR